MPINKNSLQARINNLSLEIGVHQNILLKMFFFDCFLKRLSISKFCNNFVFKGGFLLSTSLGINLRSTQDIDFVLKNIEISRDEIENIMKSISSIDVGDNVIFNIKNIEDIREDDEYGGFNVSIECCFENIVDIIKIDIATGDPITPEVIDYTYKCLISDEELKFKAYNFETIIAEKMQTVLVRGILNSRSKDFYDLLIIYKLRWKSIDKKILKQAFKNTCSYRNTIFTKDEAFNILKSIQQDQQMHTRWNLFKKRNTFVSENTFEDVLKVIIDIIDLIFD